MGICMSGSLGFLVAEKFHPIYGGAIDVPSAFAGKDARLSTFWAALFVASLALRLPGLVGVPGSGLGVTTLSTATPSLETLAMTLLASCQRILRNSKKFRIRKSSTAVSP